MDHPEFIEDAHVPTRIKVIGVGGGGSNAVDSMIDVGLSGVDFCNINTDQQALALSKAPHKLHIGQESTKGMGCGGDPGVGEKAAHAAKDQIAEVLDNCDMVFIAAGLGGGTGTGAAPVVAEIAKSLDLLTVAIVTKPFAFEGPQRAKRAEMGLANISKFVDTKIVILNDKLMDIIGPKTPLTEAFGLVNRVLAQGVQAISDLISVPGEINVDFMDVRSIMGETGGAVMGVGIGKGENRSSEAVKKACASPLQEKIVIEGARGVLISITASPDVSLQEINAATTLVYEAADPEANIIFGLVINPELNDEMRVTIIATGFPDETRSFPSAHPMEDELRSPNTDLDLETKIQGMMNNARPAAEEDETPHEETSPPRHPEPQAFFSRPAEERSAARTEPAQEDRWKGDRSGQHAEARNRSETGLPSVEPSAPSAGEHSSAPKESEKEKPDLETPAYLRRRSQLF